eukprot:3391887-Pyramimonas_sp.AAC.1
MDRHPRGTLVASPPPASAPRAPASRPPPSCCVDRACAVRLLCPCEKRHQTQTLITLVRGAGGAREH